MDATRISPALILQSRPYRENDILVTAYTLHFGKLALVARGAKKLQSKLAGHLEPLTRADLMIIAGRGWDYVGGAAMTAAYHGLRADLNKLYYAGRALGLFNRLVKEDQADSRLFSLLADWLDLLDRWPADDFRTERGEFLYALFAWQFLARLGYEPQLRQCLECGRELRPGNHFDLLHGGVWCADCYAARKSRDGAVGNELAAVSDNVVKAIRFLTSHDLEQSSRLQISRKNAKELAALAGSFLIYHF